VEESYYLIDQNILAAWVFIMMPIFMDYGDNTPFWVLHRVIPAVMPGYGFCPDIVHVHDWQTALGAAYLKIWHYDDPMLSKAASMLTIHNIAYQGVYGAEHYSYLGLQPGNFTPDKFEDHGRINFLKGGIVYADMVNTVSPTYVQETRQSLGGNGLTPFLNDKGADYIGILNGADYDRWNPASDRLIPAPYKRSDLAGKAICKRAQKRFYLKKTWNSHRVRSVVSYPRKVGPLPANHRAHYYQHAGSV
jgi:starch synthase